MSLLFLSLDALHDHFSKSTSQINSHSGSLVGVLKSILYRSYGSKTECDCMEILWNLAVDEGNRVIMADDRAFLRFLLSYLIVGDPDDMVADCKQRSLHLFLLLMQGHRLADNVQEFLQENIHILLLGLSDVYYEDRYQNYTFRLLEKALQVINVLTLNESRLLRLCTIHNLPGQNSFINRLYQVLIYHANSLSTLLYSNRIRLNATLAVPVLQIMERCSQHRTLVERMVGRSEPSYIFFTLLDNINSSAVIRASILRIFTKISEVPSAHQARFKWYLETDRLKDICEICSCMK